MAFFACKKDIELLHETVPEIITEECSEITESSAVLTCKLTNQGSTSVEYGFYYSEAPNNTPTIVDKTISLSTQSNKSFRYTLTGLKENTTYYVRAYARNRVGEAQGKIVQFTTLSKKLPTMGSTSVTNVTTNSATLSGNVASAGTGTVKERGFCLSTTKMPTIADSCIAVGLGIGSFNYTLTELEDGITFYVRAYATSEVGTAYGETMSFTTASEQLPIVVTKSVTEITPWYATLNGELESEGTSSVTEMGFCYSATTQTPTLLDEYVKVNGSSFASVITTLSEGTTYYVRAYATNGKGTAYGDVVSFKTESLPKVSMVFLDKIDVNSAQVSFNLTSQGSSPVTEMGFYYGSTPFTMPTYGSAEHKYSIGHSTDCLVFNMTGLAEGTSYYVCAYATNSSGTIYGVTRSFTTKTSSIPSVSTVSISNVSYSSAIVNGHVTSDGGVNVAERGVCWNTTGNPTVSNSKKVSGSGIGSFSVSISGLNEETTYYARAYAVNSKGTAYGEQVSFTTLKTIYLPTVTTGTVSNVSYTTATISCSVTNDGGAMVTERGICWAITSNPSINNNKQPSESGTGSFSVSLSDLNEGTTYYACAYATNSKGTAYGEIVTFTTKTNSGNPVNTIEGAIQAAFSVSDTKKVYFSQGNLQYQASTGTWRFAEHQYDMIGNANSNISSTYSGWIDLFGWGTSGWNNGANAYQPYSTSTEDSDYYLGGDYNNDLTGNYANADWGVYNKISNGGNQTGLWRTLTSDEWSYLLNNAVIARAKVNGVNGMVLLPDNITLPSTVTFVSGMWAENKYTVEQWSALESAGAVFLPASGIRYGSYVTSFSHGYCWSSSLNGYADTPEYMFFTDGQAGSYYNERGYGCSVRLVRDID